MDTCHAGKLITRGGSRNLGNIMADDIASKPVIGSGWIFMVASEADRTAIEHTAWSNGAFTNSLLEGSQSRGEGGNRKLWSGSHGR